jgi:ArsR family transcriptional regulator, arsenate/arsenite/antimonite-responsive transcriptional repressor
MKDIDLDPLDQRLVLMLRALGNPARVRIVKELRSQGECQTGSLVGNLPLSQSTISEHLRRLKEAGIVIGTIEGPATCYCVDESAMQWLSDRLAGTAIPSTTT